MDVDDGVDGGEEGLPFPDDGMEPGADEPPLAESDGSMDADVEVPIVWPDSVLGAPLKPEDMWACTASSWKASGSRAHCMGGRAGSTKARRRARIAMGHWRPAIFLRRGFAVRETMMPRATRPGIRRQQRSGQSLWQAWSSATASRPSGPLEGPLCSEIAALAACDTCRHFVRRAAFEASSHLHAFCLGRRTSGLES